MSETTQELNEAGIDNAARTLYETDKEMMGPLAAMFPQAGNWADLPQDFREAYYEQVRKIVAAYLEGASA